MDPLAYAGKFASYRLRTFPRRPGPHVDGVSGIPETRRACGGKFAGYCLRAFLRTPRLPVCGTRRATALEGLLLRGGRAFGPEGAARLSAANPCWLSTVNGCVSFFSRYPDWRRKQRARVPRRFVMRCHPCSGRAGIPATFPLGCVA